MFGSVFIYKGFASNINPHIVKTKPILAKIVKINGTIKRGDTISSLLDPYLPLKKIYELSAKKMDGYSLSRIKLGQPYSIITKDKKLIWYEYEINENDRLILQKENESFSITKKAIEYDLVQETVSGEIKTNLSQAMKRAGEKNELALKLAEIFAWDIDFIKDIRPGDHFRLLVQKRYRKGKFAGYGEIDVAFFTNRQIEYKAFLFENSKGVKGYYDENGKSLQKAFLKAPLSYSRISSGFSRKRLHPIFKEYRPHTGVDYAAPIGTPIKTVGDGTITRMGYNKGMGKFIMINHPNGFTTHYYHMSRFARGMKRNKALVQGEIIGFVGQTGYATGPHLDFRIRKNGQPIDPLKYRAPSANPIHADEMAVFLDRTLKLHNLMLTAEKQVASAKKST